MRTLVLLTFALGLLAGCGPRTRDNPSVPAGGVCQSSSQCPIDHACVGCPDEDAHCISGCSSDADCSEGSCQRLECITCPCPGRCAT
ncbi:hypothetical protein [Pyxidicoccus trucidator]|uniref:hypothetical protein n=1 Tax=Pyxidicoccus trucidator TaxID=2709662 RepID=UPI0013D932F7|nr:hypothetical protein [Pyxidicoccus trucidator]